MVPTSLTLEPDIILLMAGTNDSYGTDPGGAPARLGALLDQIFAADSHVLVVLAKLTPYSGAEAALNSINAAIPGLAQTRIAARKHLIVVDMNTGFPTQTLEDSIHPNQAGYEWMADVWYDAIGPLLD
jgi:lysophospholipase L1-like esterase